MCQVMFALRTNSFHPYKEPHQLGIASIRVFKMKKIEEAQKLKCVNLKLVQLMASGGI